MKETEADAVKIEGGEEILESVNRILSAGIPVMGHLGLTPQSIHKFGTYNVRAKEEAEAEKLVRDAQQAAAAVIQTADSLNAPELAPLKARVEALFTRQEVSLN